MDRRTEKSESDASRYQQHYEEVLSWLMGNKHMLDSRSGSGNGYLESSMSAAAALIAVIQLCPEIEIPENIRWEAFRGHRIGQKNDQRSSVAMNLEDLSRLTGIKLPSDLREPGQKIKMQYIAVIWRSKAEENLAEDMVDESNFITAYAVPFSDQITESFQGKYKWHEYGRSKNWSDLLDQWDRRSSGE